MKIGMQFLSHDECQQIGAISILHAVCEQVPQIQREDMSSARSVASTAMDMSNMSNSLGDHSAHDNMHGDSREMGRDDHAPCGILPLAFYADLAVSVFLPMPKDGPCVVPC